MPAVVASARACRPLTGSRTPRFNGRPRGTMRAWESMAWVLSFLTLWAGAALLIAQVPRRSVRTLAERVRPYAPRDESLADEVERWLESNEDDRPS